MDWVPERRLDTVPNLKRYTGPESFPEGSLLDKAAYGKYPLDTFIKKAAQTVGVSPNDELLTYYGKLNGKVIGSLVGGLQTRTEKSLLIADAMLKMQPNLAWTRGASLRVENGIALLDIPYGDGYLGENAHGWAMMDNVTDPTVYLIRWDAIVDAIRTGQYTPRSGTGYDFSLMGLNNDEDGTEWQRKHVTAYKI